MTNPRLLELANRLGNEGLPRENDKPKISTIAETPELKGYVYIPSINLYVAKEKILHEKNWYDTHQELHKQGLQMLTIPQFILFINYLKSSPSNQEYQNILDEILTVRNPWRSEWLDADFKVINDKLNINYNHRTINGKLKPQNSEPLEECLMQNKTPGIDLDSWLRNPTKQGLPRKDVKDGGLYYWCPMSDNNSVARFVANSDRAVLNCDWDPQYSNSGLGVRPCVAPR